jgi:uncharacterized BrkB/YihY/UPF0761 family membrane protein
MDLFLTIAIIVLVILVVIIGVFLLLGGTFNYEYHKDGELITKAEWPRKKTQ